MKLKISTWCIGLLLVWGVKVNMAQPGERSFVEDKATKTGKVEPGRHDQNRYLSNNKKKKDFKPKIKMKSTIGCPTYRNYTSKARQRRKKEMGK
jgi:hypothetical protein